MACRATLGYVVFVCFCRKKEWIPERWLFFRVAQPVQFRHCAGLRQKKTRLWSVQTRPRDMKTRLRNIRQKPRSPTRRCFFFLRIARVLRRFITFLVEIAKRMGSWAPRKKREKREA